MSDFGKRLKQIRKERKLTQKNLAEMLNVTQSTIANYESNLRFPGENSLKEISDQLKISTDFLLGLTDTPLSELSLDDLSSRLLDLLINGNEMEAIMLFQSSLTTFEKGTDYVERVFDPIMRKVGLLWEQGEIDISQEHYISEIVGQFLNMLGHQVGTSDLSRAVLLMVPSGEEHVLVLKMIKQYFIEAGWRVYLVGKSIPLPSIKFIVEKEDIDWIVLSVTMKSNINSLEYLIKAIRAMDLETSPKIFLGGQAIDHAAQAIQELGADAYFASFEALNKALKESF